MIECNWVTQNLRLILVGQNRIEENTSVDCLVKATQFIQLQHSEVSGYLPGGQFHSHSEVREYELHDNMNMQFSALDKTVSNYKFAGI